MPKTEAIDSLMASAIRWFAQRGFDGTSLRDIATDAGVPLSSIHTYFGSKQDLFDEVLRKIWSDLAEERNALLLKAAAAHDGVPTIQDIVRALVYPVVRRVVGADELERDAVLIIRQAAQNSLNRDSPVRKPRDEPRIFWLQCMSRVYPQFSWHALVWLFSFIIGTTYSWQVTHRMFDNLTAGQPIPVMPPHDVAERLTDGIVVFCCAGIDALYQRELAAQQPSSTATSTV